MNFHLRPYNQYILNIVTNIYLGLDFEKKKIQRQNMMMKIITAIMIMVLFLFVTGNLKFI